jgi:hypothetical protein
MLVGLTAAAPAMTQSSGDVFASDDSYWNGKRRDFPECSGLVDQHEALTRELYELDAEARRAVVPRQGELVRQLNAKARERSEVQRQLDACTRDVLRNRRPSSTVLRGSVSVDEPAPITLENARIRQVHQLSAQIDAAAENVSGAVDEFFKGVLDWASQTLQLLAQKPGEPLNQLAQGIVSYLTNDNAANHAALRKHNEPGFAPRRAGLFTPPQLDTLWQGIPLEADLDQMANWLRANGEGSQAIVFAELKPSVVPEGAPGGHGFNMRFENGAIEVLDRTNFRLAIDDVAYWWFYPTR